VDGLRQLTVLEAEMDSSKRRAGWRYHSGAGRYSQALACGVPIRSERSVFPAIRESEILASVNYVTTSKANRRHRGGIVGLATAYRLTGRFPGARVTVLEKEDRWPPPDRHNSGVLHCGLYYKPGSVKARLAVEGIRKMVAFCEQNAIPHEICGKLVWPRTRAKWNA